MPGSEIARTGIAAAYRGQYDFAPISNVNNRHAAVA